MDFILESNTTYIRIELMSEKNRNQKLVEDLKIEKENNEQLRKELQIEKENNEKLRKELQIEKEKNQKRLNNSYQDLIMNSKMNIIDELEPKIKSLEIHLKITTKELDNLRQNINNPKSIKDNKMENIITIDFTSGDKKIIYLVPCSITDRFFKFEEKFFEQYPQYSENNASFTIDRKDRKEILRMKTLQDNGITFSDVILLDVYE